MTDNKLQHIALIMDGNGRWAVQRGLPRLSGHQKGAETLQEIVKAVGELGIKYLTVYAFSTENWQRDTAEVDGLMNMLRQYLKTEFSEIKKQGIKIRFIGEREMLPADISEQMSLLEAQTAVNNKYTLCIALSYGGRHEIVAAAKRIAAMVKRDDIDIKDVDLKMFSDMLYTKDIPDPDLVIRTSGEQRISNYLLWQSAYSEFYFSPTLWPDFNKKELEQIISDFNQRERRYGKS